MVKVNITVEDPNMTEEQIKRIIEQSLNAVNKSSESVKPPEDSWKGCTPDNHIGEIQQYTEYCMNCGRNVYTNER